MPRERLVYERHKSRPVHVSVSGRNRAVPQPYTINLIHVHCGRRTERGGKGVFLAIGGPRRIFHSIPRNHSTSPFKEKFQIARVEKPVWTNRPFRLFSNYFSPSPDKFFFLRIFNRPIVDINFHMLKFFILPLLWGTFFSFFFFFLFRQILERGYLVLVRLG